LVPAPIQSAQKLDLLHLAAPSTGGWRIEPGDVIEVSLAASLDKNDVTTLAVRVGEDGRAVLPEIGPLDLAGLDLASAEQEIASACVQRDLYRRPNVTVTMKQPRQNRVIVVGAVQTPGMHEIPRGSSYLLNALVAAGGLTDDAGTQVEIRIPPASSRMAAGGPLVQPASHVSEAGSGMDRICLNLADAVRQPHGGTYLPDGSVVRIEKLEPDPIYVMGLVQKPGEVKYPVHRELRLLGAVAQAGGLTSKVADKVLVLRKTPDGQGAVAIEASLQAAKRNPAENLVLAPGDVVSIERSPATMLLDTFEIIRFGFGATLPLF
jgi:polysaccharide export outer membrane protein